MTPLRILGWLLCFIIPLAITAPTTTKSLTGTKAITTTVEETGSPLTTATTRTETPTKAKKKKTTTTTNKATTTTANTSNKPTTATSVSSTTTSTTSTPSPSSCAAIGNNTKYTDPSGFRYNVSCGVSLAGTELEYQPVYNFQACFHYCDAIRECQAFNFAENMNGSGSCHFYHVYGSETAKTGFDAAYMIRIVY